VYIDSDLQDRIDHPVFQLAKPTQTDLHADDTVRGAAVDYTIRNGVVAGMRWSMENPPPASLAPGSYVEPAATSADTAILVVQPNERRGNLWEERYQVTHAAA
jgi:hypothetical protein